MGCVDPSVGIDTDRVNFSSSILRAVVAADLVTVALLVALEGLLSADNAMVLAVLVLGINLVGDGLRNLLGSERLR